VETIAHRVERQGAIGKRLVSQESWSSVSSELWNTHEVHGTAMELARLGLSDLRRVYRDRVKLVCTDSPSQFNKDTQKPDQRKDRAH
jgi:hypothetical protein